MEVGAVCQVRPVVHLEKMHVRLQEKHPDVDLLSQIKKRLDALGEPLQLHTTTTQAIAISLQCPAYLDGLQDKAPSFATWKRASYKFLCQEFGKENLLYLHLHQENPIAAIHCVFVPIKSHQLNPQAFVGSSLQEQGYINGYQALLDRLLKQDLRTIKRMDLLAYFIEAHDYQKNNRKSSAKWPRVDHRDGTKLLLHQDKGIYYYQSLNDEQDKGTIVDYLLRRGCKDEKEVLAKVLGGYLSKQEYVRLNQEQPWPEGEQRSDESRRDPAFYQREAQAEFNKFGRHCYGETYLEDRGIEPATYQGIQGVKANFLGAIFCLYREVDIQGQGKLCSTIKYFPGEEGSKKYFQKSHPRGLSVIRPSGEIKEILFTESPIDALSHKQLYGTKHTLYLSTCGNLKKEIADGLEVILIQAQEQSILVKLGFDGDEKGREMAQQVAAIASKHGLACQMVFPKVGKDWNEMLVAHLKQSAQLNQPKPVTVGRSL
jgi:hypothetical protein